MRSKIARIAVVMAIVGLVASAAAAQISQGRIAGTVADAQGGVLPGVTVTATSPSLIGVRTTVSQADGNYMFPAMPSGTYKLVFELAGFKKVERDNIQVDAGQHRVVRRRRCRWAGSPRASPSPATRRWSTPRRPRSARASRATSSSPCPNSTDVWGALSEAPGVRMQGFDVGGSHKSQQSGYESFGIQNQARVVSDGIDHTEGVGGTGFYEDYYANEEVSVSALGADVEMNSGGAAIVTTIKSGGNEFKGLQHFSYEDGSWVGTNAAPADMTKRGYTCPNDGTGKPSCNNPNLIFWEAHFDLGGPIKRDTAWFYAAYNHFKIDKQVSGVAQNVATDLGIFDNYTAKTTAKAGQNNTFIGYYQQGRKQKPKRGLSTLLPPESVRAQDSMSRMYKGEYQRVINDRTFFSVNAGNFTLDWPMVVAVDPATNAAEGVPDHERGGRCRLERVHDEPQEAAGEGPVDLLPAREGRQPRLQVRVREHPGLVPLRPQRHVGPDPLLVSVRQRHGVRRPTASASSTPARRPTTSNGWTRGSQHRPALLRLPPGSLGAERQADLHARPAYGLPEGGLRRRHAQAASSPRDGPIFPAGTNVKAATHHLEHQHRAAARRDLRPQGHRQGRAQGVLRPLLQQPGRRLLGHQPRRPVDRRVQLPRPERQPALRRRRRSWARCACASAPTRRRSIRTSRRRPPRRSAGRWSSSCPASRRPASPTCARTTTTSRRSTARTSCRRGSGQVNVPTRQSRRRHGPGVEPARRAERAGRQHRRPLRQLPRRQLQLRHDRSRLPEAPAQLLRADQRRLPVAQRLPRRRIAGLRHRARCRPIRSASTSSSRRTRRRRNRQETTVWHYQLLGRYTFP